MERKILKCISTIDEFNIDEYQRLSIGVEIQDFTEPNLIEEEIRTTLDRYKELFKGFTGIKAMHGPFLDLKPASPDLEIQRVSYNKYLRTLNLATELDMDYIVFHSQINPFLNESSLSNLNNLQSRDFWHKIMKKAMDFKGVVLIENVFERNPEMLKELIEEIDLPNIKVNLDLGHARLGTVSLEMWIRELKNHLSYIHLHSNNGIHDQHHVPTEIEINALVNLLRKYNIDPVISLEYKTNDPSREIELLRL